MSKSFRRTRRQFLGRSAALTTAPALTGWSALAVFSALPAGPAAAQIPATAPSKFEADITPLLNQLSGGKAIVPGRVQIDIPPLAENGQSVTLHINVPNGAVKSVHIFAPRNPRPNIGNFFFGPKSANAEITTRIRLGGTQTLMVVAAFADGTFGSASAPVEVTSSACLDAAT